MWPALLMSMSGVRASAGSSSPLVSYLVWIRECPCRWHCFFLQDGKDGKLLLRACEPKLGSRVSSRPQPPKWHCRERDVLGSILNCRRFWSPLVCGAGQRIHLWNGNRHPFSVLCTAICYLGCWNSCEEDQCHSSENKSHHHRPQTVERQYGRQAARLGDQPRKVDTASQTSWKTR